MPGAPRAPRSRRVTGAAIGPTPTDNISATVTLSIARTLPDKLPGTGRTFFPPIDGSGEMVTPLVRIEVRAEVSMPGGDLNAADNVETRSLEVLNVVFQHGFED